MTNYQNWQCQQTEQELCLLEIQGLGYHSGNYRQCQVLKSKDEAESMSNFIIFHILFVILIIANDHMKYSENCGVYSNSSTKRSRNISRQSTCRAITNFSNQSSCISSPKAILHKQYTYSQLHIKNIIDDSHKIPKPDIYLQKHINSAIKIQRFWRFHLLMRRKVQELVIANLQTDKNISLKNLKNHKIYSQVLQQRAKNTIETSQQQSSLQLFAIKQSLKSFVQASIKKQMFLTKVIERVRKENKHYTSTSDKIRQSIQEYESHIKKLLDKKQYFKNRQQDHIIKLNRLNKDLVLLNMQKSRVQLEVDQIKCQVRELQSNKNQQ